MSQVKADVGYRFGVTCPGCGAALELASDLFVTDCRYCGSILRVIHPAEPPQYVIKPKVRQLDVRFHLDRYLRENKLPLSTSDLAISGVFYPYWRIDGIALKHRNRIERKQYVQESGEARDEIVVENAVADTFLSPFSTTAAAGEAVDLFPATLGTRLENVTLHPLRAELVPEGFGVAPKLIDLDQAFTLVEKRLQGLSGITNVTNRRNLTKLYRSRAAIVYWPFFVCHCSGNTAHRTAIVDAVTGRVLSLSPEVMWEEDLPAQSDSVGLPVLTVEAHHCRNCGESLPCVDSLIQWCKNCGALTVLDKSITNGVEYTITRTENETDATLFPFWAIRLPEPLQETFRRVLGAMSTVSHLVVPAFRIRNYEALYRLATRVSTAATRLPQEKVLVVSEEFEAVSVSVEEARSLAGAIAARAILARQQVLPDEEMSNFGGEVSLLFIPFTEHHYFFVDTVLQALTFESRALVTG